MKKHGRIVAWILTAVLLCSQVSLQAFAQEGYPALGASEEVPGVTGELPEDSSEALDEAQESPDKAQGASDEEPESPDKTQGLSGETPEASDDTQTPETSDEIPEVSGEEEESPDEAQGASGEEQEVLGAAAAAGDTEDTGSTVSGGDALPAESEETSVFGEDEALLQVTAEGGSVEVTRLEWLKALTEVFEMSVEEDNYPDNYYSDIDANSEDYYDIMLATEFGLVDEEAGDPLRPDEAATREFAVHTLNLCLGYLPDEQAVYTFSEASAVTYPDDIQIAINKGWLTLNGGSFLPEQGITSAEKDRMIEVAREVIASTVIDPNAGSQYQLIQGVIAVPEGTEAVLTDDNEITLYDCSVKIASGDIFVVVSGGLPIARRAVSVKVVENRTVITVENVDMEEAFSSLESQGSMEADLTQIQVIDDDVQLAYIVGGTQEQDYEDGVTYYSLREVEGKKVTAVIATKTIEPGNGMDKTRSAKDDILSVSFKISNPKLDHDISLKDRRGYVSLTADITVNVNVDPGSYDFYEFEQPFVRVPIGLFGYINPTMEGGIKGKMTFCEKGTFSISIQYSRKEGIRLGGNFHKNTFTIQTMAEVSVGAKMAAGIDVGAIKAELYAQAGIRGYVQRTEYIDAQPPLTCVHVAAHLYASLGGLVKVSFLTDKKEYRRELIIYDEKNSPVKVALHYENGKGVDVCSRDNGTGSSGSGGTKRYKYYTPLNSQYAYSGINSGTTSTGEPFVFFEYSLDEVNRATITKYNGNVAALNIPETIDGYTVVGIGEGVFRNNKRIQMVTMPDTVTEIGGGAFWGCSNLSDVVLSKNLMALGGGAFGDCDSLTEIVIPKSLKSYIGSYYGYGAFDGSDNLKDIILEEGVTKIPNHLFANSSIEKITIPDTVAVIEEGAFALCSRLKEITIPDRVTMIGASAFESCTDLKEIKLGSGLTYIERCAFKNVKGLASIRIPDSVTEIGGGAFKNCSNLSEVILSKNLTAMSGGSFGNCDSLTGIMIPKSLKSLTWGSEGFGPFEGSDNLKDITFEEGVTTIPYTLFANSSIEKITIPDTVTVIEESAFENCSGLKEIKLGSGLTTIEYRAFKNVKGLTSIRIPDSVIEIGGGAFKNCSNLSEVILSKNLTAMSGGSFGDCDSLTEIRIPKSLRNLTWGGDGFGPFEGSDNLKDIIFEEGITTIPYTLFANSGIEKISIPDTVTVIASEAFKNCKRLKEIKLSSGLTTIEYQAFIDCSSLQEIDIPDSVTSIGTYTFAGCSSLAKVKLPNTQSTIVNGMFQNCTSLFSIELPESVTWIQEYAFQNSGLTKITIPENVERIGSYAFKNCDSLTSITIPDRVTTLGNNCFEDCELLKDVKLGTGLTKIASYTFNLCPSLENIVLPYRMNTVESNAFINCTKLKELTIPRAMQSIGSNAFSYPTRMTVYGVPETYAEEWAKSVGATFVSQEKPATAVTLSESTLTVNRGSTKTLVLSITPEDFTDEVTWKSSNTSVATVSDAGVVTAQGLGDAVIQVNVGSVSASCKVTVLQPVTSIYLNESSHSMEAADVYTLIASIFPYDANDKSISWSSSDESIATVDDNGKVTALRKGTVTITASSKDGSNVSRSCTITVTNTLHSCDTVAALESPHNYENNCSDIWAYTLSGAKKIAVTFDERTEIEDGFDFLYLYDAFGTEIGKYTGKELAGQTITITGDTVKVKLVSDKSGNTWGFKVSKVEKKEGTVDQGVVGEIKCFGDETSPVTVQLLDANGTVAAQTTVANNDSYALENVAAGTYTLRVSKLNYVPRDYPVTLGNEAVILDAELRLIGDVKGDGYIDAMDKKVLYNHIASPVLTGYDFAVGDVTGDGVIDAKDKKVLYNHIAGTTSLW